MKLTKNQILLLKAGWETLDYAGAEDDPNLRDELCKSAWRCLKDVIPQIVLEAEKEL